MRLITRMPNHKELDWELECLCPPTPGNPEALYRLTGQASNGAINESTSFVYLHEEEHPTQLILMDTEIIRPHADVVLLAAGARIQTLANFIGEFIC